MESKSGGFPLRVKLFISMKFSLKKGDYRIEKINQMDSWTWHCWYCNRTSCCSSDQKVKEYSPDIKADSTDSNKEETDSDTFDLDQDLEPTQERSYVSLKPEAAPRAEI